MPTYPSHSNYYAKAIKINIECQVFFHFILFEEAKGICPIPDHGYITRESRFFCIVEVALT